MKIKLPMSAPEAELVNFMLARCVEQLEGNPLLRKTWKLDARDVARTRRTRKRLVKMITDPPEGEICMADFARWLMHEYSGGNHEEAFDLYLETLKTPA